MKVKYVKHEVFSLIFKIKAAVELIDDCDKELLSLVKENVGFLEYILTLLFNILKVKEGEYNPRKEYVNLKELSENYPDVQLKTDRNLFFSALKALNKAGEISFERDFIKISIKDNDGITNFLVDYAEFILKFLGFEVERSKDIFTLRWERY